MPRKIRELVAELTRNGFVRVRGRGKGSHRVYGDPVVGVVATIAGQDGDDAKVYQEKHVRAMIALAKKKRGIQ